MTWNHKVRLLRDVTHKVRAYSPVSSVAGLLAYVESEATEEGRTEPKGKTFALKTKAAAMSEAAYYNRTFGQGTAEYFKS